MILEKLKSFPKDIWLLLFTIIGFVIFILINQLVFVPINQLVPTYGILDFEFAWFPEQVMTIFAVWGVSGIAIETLAIYWDFLYIVGYASFIFGMILLVTRRFKGTIFKIGLWMTLTPLLAGIFDVIENINLLVMMNNASSFPSFLPFFASLMALIKFGVLILGIVFFFGALILRIFKYIRHKKDNN